MRIVIYSGYSNGLGDLSFGKKVADIAQAKYPEAEIVLLTSSSDKFQRMISGVTSLEKYNASSDVKFIPYNQYLLRDGNIEPDLLIAGPTLNFDSGIVTALAPNEKTPIVLVSEYNFPTYHMEDLTEDLRTRGYHNITQMPTGLGSQNQGIFIDDRLTKFDRTDPTQLDTLFTKKLIQTGPTILGHSSPDQYLDTTNTAVSYSHNNAKRFLTVHSMLAVAYRNTDVIMMGEEAGEQKNDKPILQDVAPRLLEKGYGQVVYQEVGQEPQIIAESANGGPTYRLIHTGRVSSEEASSLRLIGGTFSGATGDQSYSEAIATSNTIVYECQSWKAGLVEEMRTIANEVEPRGDLARAVELLSSAKTPEEHAELADLLRQPAVQDNFKLYRDRIIQNHNFTENLRQQLDITVSQVQNNQSAEQSQSLVAKLPAFVLRLYSAVVDYLRPSTDHNVTIPENEPPTIGALSDEPSSTSKIMATLKTSKNASTLPSEPDVSSVAHAELSEIHQANQAPAESLKLEPQTEGEEDAEVLRRHSP